MAKRKRKDKRISIGETNQMKLYNAIEKPVMELRLAAQKDNLTKSELDRKLFNLSNTQWKSISQILKIKNP